MIELKIKVEDVRVFLETDFEDIKQKELAEKEGIL